MRITESVDPGPTPSTTRRRRAGSRCSHRAMAGSHRVQSEADCAVRQRHEKIDGLLPKINPEFTKHFCVFSVRVLSLS